MIEFNGYTYKAEELKDDLAQLFHLGLEHGVDFINPLGEKNEAFAKVVSTLVCLLKENDIFLSSAEMLEKFPESITARQYMQFVEKYGETPFVAEHKTSLNRAIKHVASVLSKEKMQFRVLFQTQNIDQNTMSSTSTHGFQDEIEKTKIESQTKFLEDMKQKVVVLINQFKKEWAINEKLNLYEQICFLENEMNNYGLVAYGHVSKYHDHILKIINNFEKKYLAAIDYHLDKIYRDEVEEPCKVYEKHLLTQLEKQAKKMSDDQTLKRDPILDSKWNVLVHAKQYLIPQGVTCTPSEKAAIILTVKDHIYQNRKTLLDERDSLIIRLLKKLFSGWGAKNDEANINHSQDYKSNVSCTLWGTTQAEKVLLKPMKINEDFGIKSSSQTYRHGSLG